MPDVLSRNRPPPPSSCFDSSPPSDPPPLPRPPFSSLLHFPGQWSVLYSVRFTVPNQFSVYLHYTAHMLAISRLCIEYSALFPFQAKWTLVCWIRVGNVKVYT